MPGSSTWESFAFDARPEPVHRRVAILYALPALALAVPTLPAYILLPTFYAETVGVGLAVTGAVLFAVRVLDVVSDPLVGYAMDRFNWPGGRFRAPMTLGGLIAAPALYMLFAPPPGAGAAHLALWASLLYLGWTLIQIPYTAWAATISPDYHGRARLNGGREAATLVGLLLAGGVPAALAALGRDETAQMQGVALLTIGLGAVTLIPLLRLNPGQRTGRRINRPALRSLGRNRLFVRLTGAWFVNGLANGLPAAVLPLYLAHGLKAPDDLRPMLIFAYFVAGLAAMPFWLWLSRRVGKHAAWSRAMLLALAAFALVPLLGPSDVAAFAVICVVTGLALGADLALPPALQADLADWDRLKFGADRTGLFFAVSTMSQKLAMALGVGIAFPLLDWAGVGETETAFWPLVMIYAGLPVVLKACAVAMMWRHPITARRHAAILRRLARRETSPEGRVASC